MDGPTISRTPVGRLLLGLGVVVTLVVVLVAGYTAVSFAGQHTERAAARFPLPTAALTIEAPDAGMEITPGDAGQVSVDRTLVTGFRGAHPSWQMDGSHLTLRSGCPTILVANCVVKYTLRIPANTALTIRNVDGSVKVHDIHGALDVASSDGSVYVEGATGDVRVRSSDGSVRAERLTSRHVSVSSSDGSVQLAFAQPPDQLDARSADGSIRVLLPRDPAGYAVSRSTADGWAGGDVASTPGASRTVTVRTSDGSADVSYGGPLN